MKTTLVGLLLFLCCSIYSQAQCAAGDSVALDWTTATWTDGDLSNTYTLTSPNGESVDVEIIISTTASGTFNAFGVNSPAIDPVAGGFFGGIPDLGVLAGNGQYQL